MVEPKLYSFLELDEGDYLAIPGISGKIEIESLFREEDYTPSIVTVTKVKLNLPDDSRKVWAIKKEDLND
jgi:hypothetical protein